LGITIIMVFEKRKELEKKGTREKKGLEKKRIREKKGLEKKGLFRP
jgi:hypothetical protein